MLTAAFYSWRKVTLNPHVSLEARMAIFNSTVVEMGLANCQTWNHTATDLDCLERCYFRCLKKLLFMRNAHGTYGHVRTPLLDIARVAARRGFPVTPISVRVRMRQLRFLGHVERKGTNSVQRIAIRAHMEMGHKRCGKHPSAYRDAMGTAMDTFDIDRLHWCDDAKDRDEWYAMVDDGMEAATKKWFIRQAILEEELKAKAAQTFRTFCWESRTITDPPCENPSDAPRTVISSPYTAAFLHPSVNSNIRMATSHSLLGRAHLREPKPDTPSPYIRNRDPATRKVLSQKYIWRPCNAAEGGGTTPIVPPSDSSSDENSDDPSDSDKKDDATVDLPVARAKPASSTPPPSRTTFARTFDEARALVPGACTTTPPEIVQPRWSVRRNKAITEERECLPHSATHQQPVGVHRVVTIPTPDPAPADTTAPPGPVRRGEHKRAAATPPPVPVPRPRSKRKLARVGSPIAGGAIAPQLAQQAGAKAPSVPPGGGTDDDDAQSMDLGFSDMQGSDDLEEIPSPYPPAQEQGDQEPLAEQAPTLEDCYAAEEERANDDAHFEHVALEEGDVLFCRNFREQPPLALLSALSRALRPVGDPNPSSRVVPEGEVRDEGEGEYMNRVPLGSDAVYQQGRGQSAHGAGGIVGRETAALPASNSGGDGSGGDDGASFLDEEQPLRRGVSFKHLRSPDGRARLVMMRCRRSGGGGCNEATLSANNKGGGARTSYEGDGGSAVVRDRAGGDETGRGRRSRMPVDSQLADDERTTLAAMDAVAAERASISGAGVNDGGGGCGLDVWGTEGGVVECEAGGTLEWTMHGCHAPGETGFEQSGASDRGGSGVEMGCAGNSRGETSRRYYAAEVGGAANGRGTGATASLGMEGSGAMSCGSSKRAANRTSSAMGGHDSADGGGGAIRAAADCDEERVEGCAGTVEGAKRCSVLMRYTDIGTGDGSRLKDAGEVGVVASVRGTGAMASAGADGSGSTSCESSKGLASETSWTTGGGERSMSTNSDEGMTQTHQACAGGGGGFEGGSHDDRVGVRALRVSLDAKAAGRGRSGGAIAAAGGGGGVVGGLRWSEVPGSVVQSRRLQNEDMERRKYHRRREAVILGDEGVGRVTSESLGPSVIFGATFCESSEGVVSIVSRATGGCDSTDGVGGAIRAVEDCDDEKGCERSSAATGTGCALSM